MGELTRTRAPLLKFSLTRSPKKRFPVFDLFLLNWGFLIALRRAFVACGSWLVALLSTTVDAFGFGFLWEPLGL